MDEGESINMDPVQLLERVARLERDLTEQTGKRVSLEAEVKSLKAARETAIQESASSKDAAVARMQRQMRELLEEVDSLRAERASTTTSGGGTAVQEEVVALRAENASLQAQVAHYEASFRHLLGDLATLRSRFAALRGEQTDAAAAPPAAGGALRA